MVKVTQGDRDVADAICNPKDNPHMYSILCKKFAAHRIATIEECARVIIELADDIGCSETRRYAEYLSHEIRKLKG